MQGRYLLFPKSCISVEGLLMPCLKYLMHVQVCLTVGISGLHQWIFVFVLFIHVVNMDGNRHECLETPSLALGWRDLEHLPAGSQESCVSLIVLFCFFSLYFWIFTSS